MNATDEITRELEILNKRGLHARASAAFARCASKYDAEIRVRKDGYDVGGTSIMGLMLLAASKGCMISVSVTGPQAGEAMDAVAELVADRFGESE